MAGHWNNQSHKSSGGQHRGGYNDRNEQPKESLKSIELDYKEDVELFNETAKYWAEKIPGSNPNPNKRMKSTQIRNFYDFVLDLNDRAEKEPFGEVLPFVKMLNSKANYAKERDVASFEFAEMISKCVSQVNTKEQLKTFKLFFEAVIGFSKK